MNKTKASRERGFLMITICAAVVLMILCVLALTVLGIARSVLENRPDDQVPADDQTQNEPPTGEDDPVDPVDDPGQGEVTDPDPSDVVGVAVVLGASEDMGQAYLDSMVFFGESTTAHLRSRGVLSGGTSTKQVWADASNTMMLSLEILKKNIIYPETGETITIEQAVARKKPAYMVLAFGVNGLSSFAANQRLYASAYAKLINAIHQASPETTVILQTVYPVGTAYANAQDVNAKIRQLNEWLPEIARENGAYVVDTASCLLDENGMLRADYAQADGLHLSVAAYREILAYLRTHGCP